MKLYFIRHGKAAQSAPSDEARPLTDVGIRQSQNNGKILSALGVNPTKIYTSPRLRAHQTAQYIGEALHRTPEINDACNFSFSARKALKLASPFNEDAEILFVGHNPSMSQVVYDITGAQVDLSTCAMACVTGIHPDFPQSATLKWLLTPKVVAAMLNS